VLGKFRSTPQRDALLSSRMADVESRDTSTCSRGWGSWNSHASWVLTSNGTVLLESPW
jgi:hypothetical protein